METENVWAIGDRVEELHALFDKNCKQPAHKPKKPKSKGKELGFYKGMDSKSEIEICLHCRFLTCYGQCLNLKTAKAAAKMKRKGVENKC